MDAASIIHVLSIVLPFANETAIVLTNSKIVPRLYVPSCPPPTSSRESVRKLVIDLIAYLGIMLFIGKNTLQFGYATGVTNGLLLIFLSIIIPNLYLHHSINIVQKYLRVTNMYMKAMIGMGLIVVLMLITNFLESKVQAVTSGITIDPVNER